jgi:hypothetical protein
MFRKYIVFLLARISHTPRDDGGLYQGMALAVVRW